MFNSIINLIEQEEKSTKNFLHQIRDQIKETDHPLTQFVLDLRNEDRYEKILKECKISDINIKNDTYKIYVKSIIDLLILKTIYHSDNYIKDFIPNEPYDGDDSDDDFENFYDEWDRYESINCERGTSIEDEIDRIISSIINPEIIEDIEEYKQLNEEYIEGEYPYENIIWKNYKRKMKR